MNFKQFLNNDRKLQESCTIGNEYPVVVGYGSFCPLHRGYLPMISELLKLSEQHNADPIVVILKRDNPIYAELLPTVVKTLKENYPFLKVMVEDDVQSPIVKLNNFGRYPKVVLGEQLHLELAAKSCERLFGKEFELEQKSIPLSGMSRECLEAARNNDLMMFEAMLLECSSEEAQIMFDQLRKL